MQARTFFVAALLLNLSLGVALAQAVTSEEVEITSQGQTYPALLAVPEGSEPKPAVVLMHSINGPEPGYATLSERLAVDGFVVLAPEWQSYEREPALETLDALLRDSIALLRAREDVNPEAVGLTGFCIGGYHTMYFLPTIDDFAAGVAWYGFPKRGEAGNRPIDPAIINQLDAPMLIFHGTADEPSPISDIYEYATALDEAGKFFQLVVYQGEPHSFLVQEELLDTFAANDAYAQIVGFFRRTLEEGASP